MISLKQNKEDIIKVLNSELKNIDEKEHKYILNKLLILREAEKILLNNLLDEKQVKVLKKNILENLKKYEFNLKVCNYLLGIKIKNYD